MTTIAEHILNSYLSRVCFLCGQIGVCKHREFEVEAAIIRAEFKRRVRIQRAEPPDGGAASEQKGNSDAQPKINPSSNVPY